MFLGAAGAHAQGAAVQAGAPKLEEVIVTAKQREQSLQEVPLSITAFTSDALRESQSFDLRDIGALTPGLSIGSAGGGRSDITAVALRGVVPNTSDERFQGVSIFVDGIALSGQLFSLDTTQIERVEVLKGPQSATFGRATYAGAINYITRTPSGDSVTGSVRLRGGKNSDALGENYYLGGSLTMPLLTDRLWLGIDAIQLENAGLYRDPTDGSAAGELSTEGITATAFFKPTEGLSFKARLAFSKDEDSMPAYHVQHAREWLELGAPVTKLSRGGVLWPTRVPDAVPGRAASLDEGYGRPFDGGSERQRTFGSLIARYDLAGYDLSYSFGYFRALDWRISNFNLRAREPGQDPVFGSLIGTAVTVNPLTTSATSTNPAREIFENTSHQLLVVSPGEDRLRWRAGLYRFDETDRNWFGAFRTTTNPTGQAQGRQKFESSAVFGGLDLDVTERLTVGAEARYQQEELRWGACSYCLTSTFAETTRKENEFLPRLTVDFQLSPEHMLYALYSKGTKSGRLSSLSITPGTQPDFLYAVPEELDNFELGTKNAFWDGRAVLNLALYHAKVMNQHLTSIEEYSTPVGTRLITAARNVGESRINGFEFEASLRPFDHWRFGLGVGYADQKFTNADPVVLQPATAVFFPGAQGEPVVLKGKRQANVPPWNGSVNAAYFAPLGSSGLDLSVRTDALYRGSFYADLGNIAEVPDSWKVNLRVAALKGDTWEAALYGRNIFNDLTTPVTGLAGGAATCTYQENDTATYGLLASQRCLYTSIPRPREIGVEFRYSF